MRLRHGGRQNAPAKQHRQQQEAARHRRRERWQQYRTYVDPLRVEDDVRQVLRAVDVNPPPSSYCSLPPGLKMPPKGAPVPRRLMGRLFRPLSWPSSSSVSEDDVNVAANRMTEADLGRWPGPHAVSGFKLTCVWQVQHHDDKLRKICATIGTYGSSPNIRRLYHGTQATSLASIVRRGLVCGRHGMFGGGIYLAPDFMKAWGFSGYGRHHYVLLVDAALGNVRVVEQANSSLGAHIWQQGFQSVAGARGLTASYGSNKLHYDEFVVYYRDQVQLLYLAQYTDMATSTK